MRLLFGFRGLCGRRGLGGYALLAVFCLFIVVVYGSVSAQDIAGVNVTLHSRSSEMRWRRESDAELSAKVELFVINRNPAPLVLSNQTVALFDGVPAPSQVTDRQWAWYDAPPLWPPSPVEIPSGAMVVFSFNGASRQWGGETRHVFQYSQTDARGEEFEVTDPQVWISSLTFLATDERGKLTSSPFPNRLTAHLVNQSAKDLQVQSVRMWSPGGGEPSPFVFLPGEVVPVSGGSCFPSGGWIQSGERGGFEIELGHLALGTAVVEVTLVDEAGETRSLWSQLKVKAEFFDISGGWVASKAKGGNSLVQEPYLKTLKRMHINTGQIEEVDGYSDNDALYSKYPLKRFNRMADLERYDRDAMLPTIHAVEFIGEPQYGGGRPVPPQEVLELLFPYRTSRLPTSVTLSEERNWHQYAGLSDYPHYDAYRVIAPAADNWRGYDRWNGQRIAWGAPLETIGVMTRSLREHSRPKPIAYWSQGAHHDWGGIFSSRRGSPTPAELRSQAWHALGNRITSLYWFNLSLKSLLKYPDLIEPITQVNREIRMLDDVLLRSDAFYDQRFGDATAPQWEVTALASSEAALYVVHDLGYEIDSAENVFRFTPRVFDEKLPVPSWLSEAQVLHRIDGTSIDRYDLKKEETQLRLAGTIDVVGLFLLSKSEDNAQTIQEKLDELRAIEQSVNFNPGAVSADLEQLRELLP